MLGRIIKIFVSSNLQGRPSIFKKIFAWQNNIHFFNSAKKTQYTQGVFLLQICQAQFIIVSKINQGSCLGCLGGDDAPGNICDVAFKLKNALTRHIRVIHEEKMDYKCKICQAGFGAKKGLIHHVTKFHKENI